MGFYGISASALGIYEAMAIATRRMPTVSHWASQKPYRRAVLVAWTLGLAVHIAKYKI